MYKPHYDNHDFFPIGRRDLLCSNHLESPITDPIIKMGVAHTSSNDLSFGNEVSSERGNIEKRGMLHAVKIFFVPVVSKNE